MSLGAISASDAPSSSSSIRRIYVGCLPVTATDSDVEQLVTKLCPVIGVYFPPQTITGINRGFAIVTVRASEELCNKCVKTFNNCLWKGTKVKVEVAKEPFYRDRLEKERNDLAKALAAEAELIVQRNLEGPTPLPVFSGTSIRIKRRRTDLLPREISTVPNTSARSDDMPSCKKTVFTYTHDGYADETIVPSPPAVEEEKKKAKGVRKGFGEVVVASVGDEQIQKLLIPGREDEECCIDKEIADPFSRPGSSAGAEVKEVEEFDYGDETAKITRADEDDNDEAENIPSVFPHELEEKALLEERKRYLEALAGILKAAGQETSRVDQRLERLEGGEEVKRPAGRSSVIIARFDPTKDLNIGAPSNKTAIPSTTSAKIVGEAKSASAGAAITFGAAPTGAGPSAPFDKEPAVYGEADLNQLKDIFHKDVSVS
jgi:RNA recognition motif-containing protein